GGLASTAPALDRGISALERATHWIVETFPADPAAAAAGAVHYLRLAGIVTGAWLLARGADAAARAGAPDGAGRVLDARFFAEQFLPQAEALRETLMAGGRTVAGAAEAHF